MVVVLNLVVDSHFIFNCSLVYDWNFTPSDRLQIGIDRLHVSRAVWCVLKSTRQLGYVCFEFRYLILQLLLHLGKLELGLFAHLPVNFDIGWRDKSCLL